MSRGKIIILSGPSGSGKTTLYQKLLKTNAHLSKSISVTTRSKRPGEVHGKDYFFVSPKMFEYKIRMGHFLEYEKFFGNYYGTPRRYVLDLLRKGQSVLLCIDVKGAETVKKNHREAVRIFIKTPTIQDLKDRLLKRGSEDLETIQKRLDRVEMELKQARHYDYVIINANLNTAQGELNRIVREITAG